jgi:hypothetical protein
MIVVIIVVTIVIFAAALSSGNSNQSQLTTIAYQLKSLQTVTNSANQYLQDGELQQLNTSLDTILQQANQSISTPLTANKVKLADSVPAKSPVSGEFSSLNNNLNDARLNAVYDSTYAREVSYELKKITIEMQDLYKITNSKSLKSFLNTTYGNLTPLQQQLSSFNSPGDA